MSETNKMTMEERMQAFFKQSGGPNNPDIERILEHHLLHGKDHGIKGKMETVEDALRDAFTADKSTSLIVDWLAGKKIERLTRRYDREERYSKLGKEIAQGIREGLELIYNKKIEDLETEVRRLNDRIERLTSLLERQTNFPNGRDGFGLFPNDYL